MNLLLLIPSQKGHYIESVKKLKCPGYISLHYALHLQLNLPISFAEFNDKQTTISFFSMIKKGFARMFVLIILTKGQSLIVVNST